MSLVTRNVQRMRNDTRSTVTEKKKKKKTGMPLQKLKGLIER